METTLVTSKSNNPSNICKLFHVGPIRKMLKKIIKSRNLFNVVNDPFYFSNMQNDFVLLDALTI